jgi:hypothetical protein
MALMASKSNAFADPNSRLELKTCVIYLWLPVFVVWSLNLIFLLLVHRFHQYKSNRKSPEEASNGIVAIELTEEQQQPSPVVTTGTTNLSRFTERFRLKRLGNTGEQTPPTSTSPVMINRSVSVASFPSLYEQLDDSESFQPSQSIPFKIILFTSLITVIALLFASNNTVSFDIGMSLEESLTFSHCIRNFQASLFI